MKKTLLTIIIVVGFGGAIVMGYLAFSGDSSSSNPVVVEDIQSSDFGILPNGTSLDFKKLEEFNDTGRLYPFPKVSPTEVGSNIGTMTE